MRFASLAALVVATVGMVACDSGPAPTYDDLTGTVSGQVIDKVSSEPIEGATVTIAAGSLATEGRSLSATTNSSGEFTIQDVPVSQGSGGDENASATYGVRLEPGNDAYRDAYRGQVEVRFGDGGSNAAENLISNVTFPLSPLEGTVTGNVVLADYPLSEVELGLVQQLPVQFESDGSVSQYIEARTATTTTDGEGNFTFENVEVDARFDLEARLGGGGTVVSTENVPAGEDPTLELGEVDASGDVEPFKIADVSPAPGSDVGATDTSFTFTFNRPIAENEYTNGGLAEEINLAPMQAKSAKNLQPDGTLPVDVSFNDDRTELTVTPAESFEDGFHYDFNASSAFGDDQFTDAYGLPFTNTTAGKSTFEFSVGVDENAPAVPDVEMTGYTFGGGDDYPDEHSFVNAGFEIQVDDSEAEVKGYEVYARTEDMRSDRTGEAGQFKKVLAVNDELDGSEYREFDGIIDAGEAGLDGTFSTAVQIDPNGFSGAGSDRTLLAADDGSYGPVEWKVRAVSINNVRSDFTDVMAVGDSTQPEVTDAGVESTDDQGNHETIVVEFSEALDADVADDVARYTVVDDGGNERDILDEVESVDNVEADEQNSFNRTQVVISVTDDVNTGASPDEIVVDDADTDNPVTDRAGNGVDPASSNWTF